MKSREAALKWWKGLDPISKKNLAVRMFQNLPFVAVDKSSSKIEMIYKKFYRTRYVWLFIDGTFSNSWDEELHEAAFKDEKDMYEIADKRKAKLIKYECLNDDKFEFNNYMRLK